MKVLGVAALVVLASGCITTSGESSGAMKNRIVNSWLFKSSDIFYPTDTARAGFVRLSPDSVKSLEREVQTVLAGLVNVSDALRSQSTHYFGKTIPAVGGARVYLASNDEAVARSSVDSRGRLEIALDVRVLQALLRATLAARFGSANAADDDAKVAEFLELRKSTKEARSGTIFGDVLGSSDRWFEMVDLDRKNQAVLGDYLGTLMFLLSHELGHRVLGHHALRCDSAACEPFATRELEADRYATFILAYYLGPFASMLGYTTGMDTFFKYAYERIGFRESAGGSCDCRYPAIEARITASRQAEEAVEAKMNEQVQAEIQRQLAAAQRRNQ